MVIDDNIIENMNLFQLFENRVLKCADKVAVVFENKTLTYKELYHKSLGLALNLSKANVKTGDIVCIVIPNSLEYVVSILAIQKIGAICLPIDVRNPKARIEHIIKDSKANTVLVSKKTNNNIGINITKISVDVDELEYIEHEEEKYESTFDELAYCIYTSGSTGEPKGVLLYQKGIINHICAKIKDLDLSENDIICLSFGNSFVASIWQIFSPLVIGAKLVIYSEEVITNIYELFKKVSDDKVNVFSTTPSALNSYLSLVKSGRQKLSLDSLRVLIITGEIVLPSLINSFYKEYSIQLVNAYGQSECSDDTFHYKIPYSTETERVPIGKPIINTYAYILDEKLNVVPDGNVGELHISGNGLAKGYLNRPELTSERFIPNPFAPGERMYKTGDLAKRLSDGNIEYIGRMDNQVKIRGHRIELEEIESALMKHKSIKQAIVTARQGKENHKYLCAYFISDEILMPEDLREYLYGILPDYMIPTHFIRLNEIPQTLNGKIDRNALPDPELVLTIDKHKMDQLKELSAINDIGLKILKIIRDIIDVSATNSIGLNDNLFNLGVNSINFINIVVAIETEFKIEFEDEYLDFYNFSTVKSLVTYVENRLSNSHLKQI